MTPDQLKLAEAFGRVTFHALNDRKLANAFIATAKQQPGMVLSDTQLAQVQDLARRYRRQLPIDVVIVEAKQGDAALEWIAADLTKHAPTCATHKGKPCNCDTPIIPKEPWVPENAAKALALFPNKSLHQCAAILAGLHPCAYDYIAAAPIVVLAVSQGSSLSKSTERKRVCREWKGRFQDFGTIFKARYVNRMLASAGLPHHLRKLHPSIMDADQWPIIQALCELAHRWAEANPKAAAQGQCVLRDLIPEREDQKFWLNCLDHWRNRMEHRYQNGQLHLEWAARQYHPQTMRRHTVDAAAARNEAGNLADFAGRAEGREFNTAWNLNQALQAQREWHTELARAQNEQKFFLQHGYRWEQPVDYTPFPLHFRFKDYEFTALQTGRQLFEEGRDMHHCVGSYSDAVIAGTSRIYHLHDFERDRRIATVEFSQARRFYELPIQDGRVMTATEQRYCIDGKDYRECWHVMQAKGPTNGSLRPGDWEAVNALKDRLNYHWALYQHVKKEQESYDLRLAQLIISQQQPIILLEQFPNLDTKLVHTIETVLHERAKRTVDQAEIGPADEVTPTKTRYIEHHDSRGKVHRWPI